MSERTSIRNFAEIKHDDNLAAPADLGVLNAATQVVAMLLISLLWASASQNMFAQESEVQAELNEVDSVTELANSQAWIERNQFRGTDGADFVLVQAEGLERTALNAEMKDKMVTATNRYIDSQLAAGASNYISFDVDYIVKHFVVPDKVHEESENVSVGTGTMYTQYKQLRFDGNVRNQLNSLWTEQKSKFRMMQLGLLGGGVFVMLSIAFLFFRINHATRGFYAGRLHFFATVVILAVIISGIYAVRLLPWY